MNKRPDAKAPSNILWQIRVTEDEDSVTARLCKALSQEENPWTRSRLIRFLIREKAEEMKSARKSKQRTRA